MSNKAVFLSTDRKYRQASLKLEKEQQIFLQIEESDLLILITSAIAKEKALDFFLGKLQELRRDIESYAIKNKAFVTSLVPLEYEENNSLSSIISPVISPIIPPIIKDMHYAGKLFDVGPFAAVAGSVAEYIARAGHAFLKELNLPDDILVENGGDIYMISSKERIVGLLDKPEDACQLGLKIKPTQGLSICTSSATIGHSLSFGKAELMTLLATKGSIADAGATSLCNMVQSSADFQKVLDRLEQINNEDIKGLVASCDNELCAFGDIELVLV